MYNTLNAFKEWADFGQNLTSSVGLENSFIVPKEFLITANQKSSFQQDEIAYKPENYSNLIIYRNLKGEPETIEVICDCGKKTTIKLTYM